MNCDHMQKKQIRKNGASMVQAGMKSSGVIMNEDGQSSLSTALQLATTCFKKLVSSLVVFSYLSLTIGQSYASGSSSDDDTSDNDSVYSSYSSRSHSRKISSSLIQRDSTNNFIQLDSAEGQEKLTQIKVFYNGGKALSKTKIRKIAGIFGTEINQMQEILQKIREEKINRIVDLFKSPEKLTIAEIAKTLGFEKIRVKEITQSLRKKDPTRITYRIDPNITKEKISIIKCIASMNYDKGKSPSIEMIAEMACCSPQQVINCLKNAHKRSKVFLKNKTGEGKGHFPISANLRSDIFPFEVFFYGRPQTKICIFFPN